jgi:5'-3' exonuclease
MFGCIVVRLPVQPSSSLACQRQSEPKLTASIISGRRISDHANVLDRYVDYAMHRVRLLQYHKITPYVVFDGGLLPAKKGTEVERKRYGIPSPSTSQA